jgi:hypothetical protein
MVCSNCGLLVSLMAAGNPIARVVPPNETEPFERVVIVLDRWLIHRCAVSKRSTN